ncbi:anti-sigma regulatory factor [Planctomyces sp. SH-PL14]|uniref:anti-sigma regulatory factor n=1 Tax=Planctomyces sp. SH-PL14 TaxID=1632864 RepID=UPI00078D307F|nr:anti-sigma regulatory factor [Planctomyces sp. SH-PL14]AMV20820.1 Serine/threonine-protein kinase RsbT [Planctomyces sp. SH-PL14]
MPVLSSGEQPVQTEPEIVMARQAVRKLTQELRFSLVDQTKMVTAASELARNTVIYGGGGRMVWEVLRDGDRAGLRLTFSDEGPGIPDMKLALTDGWTSGSGMGMGLTGSRRLVNEFDIESEPGKGTRVTITRWK